MDKSRDDPKHWRNQAKKARAHAEKVADPDLKRMMIALAENYEHLVRRPEQRLRKSAKSKRP
jgi:hypothetical protein